MIEVKRMTGEEITDEIKSIWRDANKKAGRNHYRHTPEFREVFLGTGYDRDLVTFGLQRDGAWFGFFNIVVDDGKIEFTAAEKRLFGVPVRLAIVSLPGLPGIGTGADLIEVSRQLFALMPELDGIGFGALDLEGPLAEPWLAGRGGPGFFPYYPKRRVQRRYLLDAPELIDKYDQKFSAKTRNNLRRKFRKMEREHGPLVTREMCAPEEMDDFLRDGGQVIEAGWKAKVLGDELTELRRRYYRLLADRGMFLGFVLYAGDRPVAMADGLINGSTFHFEHIAFDPEFGRHSPGLGLLLEVFSRIYTREYGFDLIDFGYGHAAYKAQYTNRGYPEVFAYFYRDRPKLRIALVALAAYHAAYDGVKALLEKLNLRQKIKKLVRS
jgi:Acetyltransferase (GNAT) domain